MKRSQFLHAGTVLAVVAFVLPPLTVFMPLGAAPVLVLAALALLVLEWRRAFAHSETLAVLAALLIALGLWATASGLWSIIPKHSLVEGMRFLAESAAGLVIFAYALSATGAERRTIAAALVAGIMLSLLLLCIERFGGEPITHWWRGTPEDHFETLTRFDRGVTVLVLSLWPAVFAQSSWWRRIALIAAVLAMSVAMVSAAALLAAALSLATFVIARFAPRLVASVMILGVFGLGIALPLVTPGYDTVVALYHSTTAIKPSGIHRLLIWRFAADRAAERPILGWGMDASRAIPGGTTDFNTMLPALHYPSVAEALPLHPHDAALQWLLELGIPGLALGLAIVIWPLWQIGFRARLSPDARAGALAWAAAALPVAMLSFGIWQSWWLSTLWLTAALYAAECAKEPAG